MFKLKSLFFIISLLIIIFLSTDKINAQVHDGLYFRFLYGIASVKAVEKDYDGYNLEYSGTGSTIHLQAGWTLINSLIPYLDLGATSVDDPDVEIQGQKVMAREATLEISEAGLGLTYYLMPDNFFLSFGINVSRATIDVKSDIITVGGPTDRGFGITAMLGKEWPVKDKIWIGAALIGHYSTMKTNEGIFGEKDVTCRYIGLAFTATYN